MLAVVALDAQGFEVVQGQCDGRIVDVGFVQWDLVVDDDVGLATSFADVMALPQLGFPALPPERRVVERLDSWTVTRWHQIILPAIPENVLAGGSSGKKRNHEPSRRPRLSILKSQRGVFAGLTRVQIGVQIISISSDIY